MLGFFYAQKQVLAMKDRITVLRGFLTFSGSKVILEKD